MGAGAMPHEGSDPPQHPLAHRASVMDWQAAEIRDQAVRLWMVGWDQPDAAARISALCDLARLLRADAAAMRASLRPAAQTRPPGGGNMPRAPA